MNLKNLFRRHKAEPESAPQELLKDADELQKLCTVFETLNKMKQSGLLYFDFTNRNVTIAQVLAEHFVYDNDEWQRFLHQLHLWAAYQYSINEYSRLYNKSRADAEAEAYRKKNEGRKAVEQETLTDAERHLARMRAAQKFDAERASAPVLPLPDVHFIVLGIADGQPVCVSRLINGKYETAVVPGM